MFRKVMLGVGAALVAGAGVGVAVAADPAITGTNTACATATATAPAQTVPSHTVAVDGTTRYTIPAMTVKAVTKTASSCNTVTYTIPTVTSPPVTVTQTVTTPPTSTTPTTTTPTGGGSGGTTTTPPSGGGTTTTPPTGGGTVTPPSGTVPCALTHAAGAGPTSCWATHTGVQGATGATEAQIEANPSAVGFTKVTPPGGSLVITKANTIVDHEWIDGCIQIADGADNTVIKDDLVTSAGGCSADDAGGSAINTGQGPNIAKNTLIEDTTVDGGTPAFGSHDAGITVDGGDVLRVNLFGFAQGFISDANTAAAPALFVDDYGHDYYGCSHDDGTWFNTSSYVTFDHGWIETNDPTQEGSDGCSTAALAGGSDYGPQDYVVFEDNYAEGATGEDTHSGCGSTNSTFIGNALSDDKKDYGSGFDVGDTGNAWSGNIDADTGATIPAQGGC